MGGKIYAWIVYTAERLLIPTMEDSKDFLGPIVFLRILQQSDVRIWLQRFKMSFKPLDG